MKDCYCKKPYLEWFTYHLIIVYIHCSNIDMFNDIENTLLDNDLQVVTIYNHLIQPHHNYQVLSQLDI